MDCQNCSDNLTAYLDEELTDPESDEIRQHLDGCPPCREEHQDLKASMSLIAVNTRQIDPAPQIWHLVRARLVEMPPPTASSIFFRFLVVNRWATALGTMAVTVMLAGGVWGYMEYRHSQIQLESYMNDYIQMRNITEKLHNLQEAEPAAQIETAVPIFSENPFAEIRPVSFTNPFRAEER